MRLLKRILPTLDPQAAPIIWRLAKLDRSGGVRKPLTLAILLAAATSAIGIAYVASLPEVLRTARFMGGSYQFHWNLFDALAGASLMLLLICPPVIAAITAILVSRDSHSDAWVLIQVTNLTRRPVFQGYAMAALYRLRLLLAISFGLLPLIAFGAAGYSIRSDLHTTDGITGATWALLFVIMAGLILITLWGLCLLAVVWGVRYGLMMREPTLAGAFAAITLLVLVMLIGLVGYMIQSLNILTGFVGWPFLIPLLLWIGMAPYYVFNRALQRDGSLPDQRLT